MFQQSGEDSLFQQSGDQFEKGWELMLWDRNTHHDT